MTRTDPTGKAQPAAPARRYRVAQWATGNIGLRALRTVIEHPRLELVGLWVHSEEKAGRDAGELCGLSPVGVKATRSSDDIAASKPDCILYMPQGCDLELVCRLLASGANVVTTRGEFHNPAAMDPAVRERVERACREGRASIHSTGSSPGFITEAVPLVLTSIQRRLDALCIDEYADLSSRNSPDMLFRLMGFGRPPGPADERRLHHFRESFGPSLRLVASALSLPVDSLEVSGGFAAASRDLHIAAGVVPAGTVAAQRTCVTAVRRGQPLLRFTATWYCGREIDADWDLGETGWRVQVEGDTPLDVRIRFPVPAERWAAVSPGLTAHRAVNAVPFVCEAPPGIRTTLDLPQIIADLG
jgi:4-hydroxy-tetrahydrodipicolinate reductase